MSKPGFQTCQTAAGSARMVASISTVNMARSHSALLSHSDNEVLEGVGRPARLLIVAATASGDLSGALGPRRWDRAINALVATALIAAIIAHLFPFIVSGGGLYPLDLDSGLSAFLIGFVMLTNAPLDPFFETFSLPLIAAFVGLMYQRRPGWMGSLAPLVCSVVGLTCLGSAYFWVKQETLAYGYFVAEATFLLAAVASAVRLTRLRRSRAMWDAKEEAPYEPAASASQELLSRYRKNW